MHNLHLPINSAIKLVITSHRLIINIVSSRNCTMYVVFWFTLMSFVNIILKCTYDISIVHYLIKW